MLSIFTQDPYRSILYALGILVVGLVLVKFLTDLLKQFIGTKKVKTVFEQLNIDKNLLSLILSGIRYFLYIIVVVLALGQFGVTIMFLEVVIYMIIISIFVMIVISLKDFVMNAAAGIYFVKNKQINLGDKLKINGFEGVVESINIMNVQLKEEDGKVVIIPNSQINNKIITKLK